jgi:hypothetical protein
MRYLKLYEDFMEGESLPGVDMPTSDETFNHLILLENRGKDKNILIIPGTGEGDGGFASDYVVMSPKLSKDFNVYSCNWPSNFNVEEYAKECVEDIEKIGGLWTVGGYSFGYRMAYKIAKILEDKKSENFLYKVFGIDGGVPASKEEEMTYLLRDNPPRIAVAYTKEAIEKSRKGKDIIRDKDFFIFRDKSKLDEFMKSNKCQTYLEDGEYTPDDISGLDCDYIVENKFPKGEDWKRRYVNTPGGVNPDYKNSEGKSFIEQDTRMISEFIDRNKTSKTNDNFTGPLKSEVLVIGKSSNIIDDSQRRVSQKISFEKLKDTSIGHDNICAPVVSGGPDGTDEVSGFLNNFLK